MYQKNIGGVDHGDQNRLMMEGFENVNHFKKLYNKAYIKLFDFNMMNSYTAWNLATNTDDSEG